jgi:hypothetical protein
VYSAANIEFDGFATAKSQRFDVRHDADRVLFRKNLFWKLPRGRCKIEWLFGAHAGCENSQKNKAEKRTHARIKPARVGFAIAEPISRQQTADRVRKPSDGAHNYVRMAAGAMLGLVRVLIIGHQHQEQLAVADQRTFDHKRALPA